jgi:AcrR family transcriptional regulator
MLDKIISFLVAIDRALALNIREAFPEITMKKKTEVLKPKKTTNEPYEHLIHSAAKNTDLIQRKRQQIVDGACQVFFEKGYHPTTIRDIARACDMSMGQLYHYITSKDDVLYLVHRHVQSTWHKYLENSNYEEIKDPIQKLSKALHRTLKFAFENRRLLQFVNAESKYLDKKHLEVVLDMDERNVIGFWHKMLREVNAKKSIKGDLGFLASLITYLVVFPALRGWTLRGMSLKQEQAWIIPFIFKGLGQK